MPEFEFDEQTMAGRIERRLAAISRSAAAVSAEATGKKDAIRKIYEKQRKGESFNPRKDTLEGIARVLGKSVDWLLTGADLGREVLAGPDAEGFDNVSLDRLPIRGAVAAGTWLETAAFLDWDDIDDFVEGIAVSPSQRGLTYGLKVRGTSINKLAVEGDVLVCLDASSGVEFEDGDIVVIERIRDQGALREVTAKRLRRRAGKWVLVPESTDPLWQQIIEIDELPQEDAEVRFVAKVKHIIKTIR